jgi:hypothetical protein
VSIAWIGWMLALAFWHGDSSAEGERSLGEWLGGGLGMGGLLVLLARTGGQEGARMWFGTTVVVAAAFSVVWSLVECVWFVEGWHWGMRLTNRMVYGGWNAVCSGLTWAFAAVWALALGLDWKRSGKGSWLRLSAAGCHVALAFASLATLSRGALLVLLAGHAAALLVAPRRALWGCARLVAVLFVFHSVLPPLTRAAAKPPELETEMGRRYPRVIDGNPLREWTKRADTGRMEMYGAVLAAMNTGGWRSWMFGHGLAVDGELWHGGLDEHPPHPHSLWMATLFHGGLPALAILLGIALGGLACAFRVARTDGWVVPWILAAAGCAGLLFDGQSVAAINTIPRFEPLLFWTGLALAAGCRRNISQRRAVTSAPASSLV